MRAYWISLPHATVAIVAEGGKVVQAPPIAAWARGRQLVSVLAYYRRKGAEIVELGARSAEGRL